MREQKIKDPYFLLAWGTAKFQQMQDQATKQTGFTAPTSN